MTAIPSDQELSGFAAAFDTKAMARFFETSLPERATVESCKIERFRYRRGERASFLYELTCCSERNGQAQKIWANGSLFKGKKARRLHQELVGTGRVGHIPEIGMFIELFPSDRRMKNLRPILEAASDELLAAFSKGFGEGTWEIASSDVSPVRYRPSLAAVFRARVTARNGSRLENKVFYIKVYGEGDPLSIFERHDQERRGSAFQILRPLSVLPSLRAIVWPEAPGTSLASELAASEPDMDAIEHMISALAEFHDSGLDLPEQSPAQAAARAAQKNAAFVSAMMPALATIAKGLAIRIPSHFSDIGFAPLHHDMKPEHLLCHQTHTTFLDVEGIARSDPLLDIGNLLARIHSGPAFFGFNQQTCKAAMRLLAEEVKELSIRSMRNRLMAAFALGKMKLATYAVAHQMPGWPQLAEAQLEEASLALIGNELPAS